ncbi:MAG: acyl-homoserine-lactone synthase [Sphingomonas bacterium]
MVQLLDTTLKEAGDAALNLMFAARKSVFVDLLRWNVPVRDGCHEIDQFDDDHARYLILLADDGRHLASTRLLPTTRPHILDTLFPDLCEHPLPRSPRTREITRFCLDRSLRAVDRRQVRDQLVTAIVEHAVEHGITTYTGVAEMGWFQQILSFGWDCRPLGLPSEHEGAMLCALKIAVEPDTPACLAAAGIWSPVAAPGFRERRASRARG